MKSSVFYATFISLGAAMSDASSMNTLQKRESGEFSCYTTTNIFDFSALCPNINYPINNDRGLSIMGTLFFALATTTVPDDTVYHAQENIICTVNGRTGNITTTIGGQVGGDIISAGAAVTFTLALPNTDGSSICMFTEGTDGDNKNVTDPITLAQARTLLYTMLTAPAVDCKTCGRIPIHYPNVTDGTNQGGILKIDRTSSNNCIGKCVGPNSFSSASVSPSAGLRLEPFSLPYGLESLTFLLMAWLFGAAVFGLRFVPLAKV